MPTLKENLTADGSTSALKHEGGVLTLQAHGDLGAGVLHLEISRDGSVWGKAGSDGQIDNLADKAIISFLVAAGSKVRATLESSTNPNLNIEIW